MPDIALHEGTQRSPLSQDGDLPFWIETQDGFRAGLVTVAGKHLQNRSLRRLAQNAS